jgi:hypothetical protein
MKDNYDFSNGRKNLYAKKLKEEGYTVMIHHSPEDIKHQDENTAIKAGREDFARDEYAGFDDVNWD